MKFDEQHTQLINTTLRVEQLPAHPVKYDLMQ